jgi:hypothetical protein
VGASLTAAREAAAVARTHVHAGRDPIAERDAEKSARRAAAMLEFLQGTMRKAVTVHGFRSTFRDRAAERTNYPRELAEMARAQDRLLKMAGRITRVD